jgi:hypothetical protein
MIALEMKIFILFKFQIPVRFDYDVRLYLDDVPEAIGKIEKYTEGLSYEQFRKDEKNY